MFGEIDRLLTGLTGREVLFIAMFSVGLLGLADYVTGHEFSVAFFYLGPVALAAWYASRSAGIGIALLACLIWYLADIESGYPKSHPAIPIWNALVRFGFFLSNALLLAALRNHLAAEQQLARTDAMTGVLNNRAFSEQLEYSLALARRNGSPLSLAYIDLDDFKQINDALGHAEGDRVLCAVAQALQDSSRRTDVVARLGGDEFALLLPETDLSGARLVIGEIKQQLDGLSRADNLSIACSIGAVAFPEPPSSASEAVKAADKLMYEVKRQGKNAIALGLYDPLTGVAEQVGGWNAEPAPPPPATLPKSGNRR
jgi:diguanylate cyclase (GGDEF)-like protein